MALVFHSTIVTATSASLLGLLKLVLTKNNFMFNGNNYLQVQGTTMGTRLAPCFANLYMGYFEEEDIMHKEGVGILHTRTKQFFSSKFAMHAKLQYIKK